MTIVAPERITIAHKSGKSAVTFWGAMDTAKDFTADYVRRDIADRSQRTHNHEFAEIKEAFDSLPEIFSERAWATSADALRKHALIQKGWCDVLQFHYPTREMADKEAPRQKAVLLRRHGYVIGAGQPTDNGGMVVVFKIPHSQSLSAMGAKAFQESKSDVLEWIKDMMQTAEDLRTAQG